MTPLFIFFFCFWQIFMKVFIPSVSLAALRLHVPKLSSFKRFIVCLLPTRQTRTKLSQCIIKYHAMTCTGESGDTGLTRIFRRFRKIAKREYLLHVCLSIRMEQLGSHWKDFHEIWYLIFFFPKSVQKNQVSLKSDMNLHEDLCTFMTVSRWILLRMRNVSEIKL